MGTSLQSILPPEARRIAADRRVDNREMSDLYHSIHRRALLKAGCLSAATALGLGGCVSPGRSGSYTASFLDPDYRTVVLEWTDIMLQAVRDLDISPPMATRGFAMAHLAGSIASGNRSTLLPDLIAPQATMVDAAFTTAFSVALEEAFGTSFAIPRRLALARVAASDGRSLSIEWGSRVARQVIRMRIGDGAEPSRSQFYSSQLDSSATIPALVWRPTVPVYGAPSGPGFEPYQRGLLPGWGAQKTWLIADPDRFQPSPFPHPDSTEFAAQFDKIKVLGRDHESGRTDDQSQIALFWEDGPTGITNPGHFQLLAIDAVRRQDWTPAQQASFFATLSLGQADAAICAWRAKYQTNILRPETAIRYARARFGLQSKLEADANWQSYIPTPAFPTYVSGHSAFGAVSTRIMAKLFGTDRISLTGRVPDSVNWPRQLRNVTRSWSSLNEIAEENGLSRELGGVHWETDNLEGLAMGRAIADEIVAITGAA